MWFFITILFNGWYLASALSIALDNGAFILRRPNRHSIYSNESSSEIFLPHGCAISGEQSITAQIAGKSYSKTLYPSVQNYLCAVAVKVAKNKINVDKPYLDVIVFRDHTWSIFFKQKLCVMVQLTNSAGSSISASCSFAERDSFRHSCLIRQEIPFSWFNLNRRNPESGSTVNFAYAVGPFCTTPQFTLPTEKISLFSDVSKFQVIPLSSQEYGQLSLLTRSNLSFSMDSMNSLLVHYRHNPPENMTSSRLNGIEFKLWIDSRLEIISTTPLEPRIWTMKIESATEPNYHTTLTLSLIDGASLGSSWDDFLLAMLLRLKKYPETSFANDDDAKKTLIIHWSIKFRYDSRIGKNGDGEEKRVTTRFPIVQDVVYSLVPIAKSTELINTAIFTGTQVATPMRVFSISNSGKLRDVTDESHCISSSPRLLKTSPTCSSVYVDGSELRGLADILVHIQHQDMNTNAKFTVWYPKLPITVWVSDPILNTISDWNVAVWKWLPKKKRRDARQFACKNRHQQAEVRILSSFHVVDEATGDRTYLTGDKELMFDVTSLASSRIQTTDPEILAVKKKSSDLFVTAKKPGTARVVVKALSPNIDYGSMPVVVTEDRVSISRLMVRPVTDVKLELIPRSSNMVYVDLISRVHSSFTHQYQHGALEIVLLYSDGQKEHLEEVEPSEYSIGTYVNDEAMLKVRQLKTTPNIELVALDDKVDATLTVELRSPAYCEDPEMPPIISGHTMVHTFFGLEFARLHAFQTDPQRLNSTLPPVTENGSNLQPILAVLLTLALVIGLFHLIYGHTRGFHNGYEKLVVPLLARLSSNSSIASEKDDDDSKEWIWLPKPTPMDNNSLGSRYSQRSTLGMSEKNSRNTSSSPIDDNTRRSMSISYRGSEISVFISPTAAIAVHENPMGYTNPREFSSWRSMKTKSRPKLSKKLYVEGSSSEHENLGRYTSSNNLINNPPERRVSDNNTYWRWMPEPFPVEQDLFEQNYQSFSQPRRHVDMLPPEKIPSYTNGRTRKSGEYGHRLRETIA
uniref:Transmembrane protein family 132 middle domain-containing protein n=1 Tax=Acrobeloides nanus TaxID=290746 RepID=A0A914C113_9BILA